MTRTFASREELMISLINKEKWEALGVQCHYDDSKSIDTAFISSIPSIKKTEIMLHSWKLCDGKTIWHKVEEKTELDLMKEKYASGDYVLMTPHHKSWIIVKKPFWDCDNYKLIHKKHKDILDAYLADNSVEIEIKCRDINAKWEWIDTDFIKNYDEDFEYRLKPKKKIISLAMFTCQQTMDTDWIRPAVFETLEDYKKRHWADYFINHHEIPNTRYEREIDDD